MDRSQQHTVEFLALFTAAALAELGPIYVLDAESGSQWQLDEVELAFGVFQRGAAALRRAGRTFQRRRNQSTSDSTAEMMRQVTIGK